MKPVFVVFQQENQQFEALIAREEPYLRIDNAFLMPAYLQNARIYSIPSFIEIGAENKFTMQIREVPDVFFGCRTDLALFMHWLKSQESGMCPTNQVSAYCFFQRQDFVSLGQNAYYCANADVFTKFVGRKVECVVVFGPAILPEIAHLRVFDLRNIDIRRVEGNSVSFLGPEKALREAAFRFWAAAQTVDSTMQSFGKEDSYESACSAEPCAYANVSTKAKRFLMKNPGYLL